MPKNPMLEEGFNYSSMGCEPLVDHIATKVLGQASPGREEYGEGGGYSYQMGFRRPGQKIDEEPQHDVYYFSGGEIAKQPDAQKFLGWAMISADDRLIFAAEEIHPEFAKSLREHQTGGVVFLLVKEDPWFEVWTEGEGG